MIRRIRRLALCLATALALPTAPAPAAPVRSEAYRAAQRTPYNVHAPEAPVAYTSAQKEGQQEAGAKIVAQINAAIAAKETSFTIAPGVYRIAKAFQLVGVHNFTLRMVGVELIIGSGSLIVGRDSSNLTFLGPAKIDSEANVHTQGIVRAYDAATGLCDVEIMPGYELSDSAKGTVEAFSTAGVYLENPSWVGYEGLKVVDAPKRLAQAKLGVDKAGERTYKTLYQPGNLLAFRLHGSPLLVSSQNIHGLTLKDLDVYTGSGIGWGGGTGDFRFINIKGIRRPGTNRLMGSGGMQMSNLGGSVLIDGCEFSNVADDLVDYGGGGTFMVLKPESPRRIITWRGSYKVGDTLNFYGHTDFHLLGSAQVLAVEELKDEALQVLARDVVKNINKGADTGDEQPVRRVTLDRDVQVSPGNFVDNGTSNRAQQFTIRNSYFHDAGVRVMLQGFKHGLIENNRFERISGGLSMAVDFWWWGGPANQDITVRNNVFRSTTFRNGWGTGRASVEIAAGEGPKDPTQGVAIHGVNISGNTFDSSSNAAILVANASDVIVRDNIIRDAFTLGTPVGVIQLRSVERAQVENNTIQGSRGKGIILKNSHAVTVRNNTIQPQGAGAVSSAHSPQRIPARGEACHDSKATPEGRNCPAKQRAAVSCGPLLLLLLL